MLTLRARKASFINLAWERWRLAGVSCLLQQTHSPARRQRSQNSYERSLPLKDSGYTITSMCLAVPGKITGITGEDPLMRMGKIDFGGILKEASLAYVPEAQVGDYVIVHVGFAISRLDEDEANKVFEYLREMEDLSELQVTESPPEPEKPQT